MNNFLRVLEFLKDDKGVIIQDVTYALVDDRLHWITLSENGESYSYFECMLTMNEFIVKCEFSKIDSHHVIDLPELKRKESDADFDFRYMPEHDCPNCCNPVTRENCIRDGCVAHCPHCYHAFYVAPKMGTKIRRVGATRAQVVSPEDGPKRDYKPEPDLDKLFETAKPSKFKIRGVS